MNVAERMSEDGFVTEFNTELLTKVAEVLERFYPQIHASVYHSGGGNFGILVEKQDGTSLLWGDCDGFWAADIMDTEGGFVDSILTKTPFGGDVESAVALIRSRS